MVKRLWRILMVMAVVFGAHGAPYSEAATIALPKTGQTGCWDASGNPLAGCIGPLATGQDGKLLKGAAWPTPRFIDNANGTVTDDLTGLVWLKNANCFGLQNWTTALNSANTLVGNNTQCTLNDGSLAGDWRLPSRKELHSLLDRQNANPALPAGHPFSGVQSNWYWSSSTYVNGASSAWFVSMYDGSSSLNNKLSSNYVWPVRAGQFGDSVISVLPASKDFGAVAVAGSSSQTFTISNSGSAARLQINAMLLSGTDAGQFALNVGNGSGGTCGSTTPIITPGGNCTVSVTFSPSSTGAKSASLRISGSDVNTPNVTIPLSSSGAYTVGTSVVGGNGSISCSTPVISGGTSNCTITPAAGYRLATFTDNTVNKLAAVVANAYNITNVTADHAIAGTFVVAATAPAYNTLTFIAGPNGSISGPTYQTVGFGGTAATVTAVPASGYHFVNWTGTNGFTTTFAGSLMLSGVSSSYTITANFDLDITTGVCGSSNGGTFSTAPTSNLCTVGTAYGVNGSGPWNWACVVRYGWPAGMCTAKLAPAPATTAKLYLGNNDSITVSNSGATIYGGSGTTTVTISAGASGITLDQNIGRIILPGPSTSYTFTQTGNKISIHDTTGSTLIVTAPLQNSGTQITFSDGTAAALLTAGVMTLGGATIGSTATALTLTLTSNPAAPPGSTSARIYLADNDNITISSSGATVYGGAGTDTITIAPGISGVILDQNIERIIFTIASTNYQFKQTGNKLNIYDTTGSTLLVSVPLQGGSGTQITFSDGTATALLSAGVMTLGGATVSSTTVGAVTPMLK